MPEEVEQEEEAVSRSQMWKHEDIVAWLTEEGVIDADSSQAEVVAAFAANRNTYRKTDRYRNLVESHKGSAEEEKAARAVEREAAKAERAAEREAAKVAKAEAAAAKAAAAPAEAAPAAPAKAAAKATKVSGAKKVAKSTKASASTAENPFA